MIDRSFVEVSGGRLEVEVTLRAVIPTEPGVGASTADAVPSEDHAPTLVWLHEGLGSIELWRGVQHDVAARIGAPSTIAYARHGHGASAPATMPRPVDYMHHEADVVLPELLAALGVARPHLVGHSDGASIALLYAGAGHDVASVTCIAPHVFVEPESVRGVEDAERAFATTDMAVRMGRYHDDAEATFRGWSDVWRSPAFRVWNIEDRLGRITAPVLVVQGLADQYGTIRQVEAIEAGVAGSCERLVLTDAGHAPHLDARAAVCDAIADFVVSARR